MRLFEIATEDLQGFAARLKAKYDLQSLWLYMLGDRDIIKLDSIIVSKQDRKTGVGSNVMQEITDYADEHNLRIALTPAIKGDPGETTSRGRLVRFYKRFGFKENKGRYANYSISAGMIRDPQ